MADSRPLSVLVVDDHAEWRFLVTHALEAEYDVTGYAERGDQVVEVAWRCRPDVVTLDIFMPGQSGLEVLPALRAALPDAIIIIVSTTVTPLYEREAFARGADGYVTKNRLFSDLIPAISDARGRTADKRRQRA